MIHKEAQRIYYLDENVDAELKQDVIVTVDKTYLSEKQQRFMGFHSINAKSLMDRLMKRYRKIQASDLEACRMALAEPIEVNSPTEVYF